MTWLATVDPLFVHGHVSWIDFLILLIRMLVGFGALMGAVTMMIWFERKAISDMQSRIGPQRWGPFGILQTMADGLKLILKEDLVPEQAEERDPDGRPQQRKHSEPDRLHLGEPGRERDVGADHRQHPTEEHRRQAESGGEGEMRIWVQVLSGEEHHLARQPHLGRELPGGLGELGRGARVQAQLVDDLSFCLRHCSSP